MKNKFLVFLMLFGSLSYLNAFATDEHTCTSPVCDNGKTCTVTGSTYVGCACIGWPTTYPSCTSGIAVANPNNPPQLQGYTANVDTSAVVFDVAAATPTPTTPPPQDQVK